MIFISLKRRRIIAWKNKITGAMAPVHYAFYIFFIFKWRVIDYYERYS